MTDPSWYELLPTAVSFAVAAVIVPAVISGLDSARLVRTNYRGAPVTTGSGIAAPATVAVTLAIVAPLMEFLSTRLLDPRVFGLIVLVFGVSAIGLLDDVVSVGSRGPRGVRGHLTALVRGRMSTGVLKAGAALGISLFVMSGRGLAPWEYLMAVGVIVLSIHVFNLLDLRPGRSGKVFILALAALVVGTAGIAPLAVGGVVAVPLVLLLPYDLREKAMIGETGASAMGAAAGFVTVVTTGWIVQSVVLAALLCVALYGEARSINAAVERLPVLRQLDSLGRLERS